MKLLPRLGLVGLAVLSLAGCGVTGAAPTPTPTPSIADVRSLSVGDCLTVGASLNHLTDVPALPCSTPHDTEVYATVILKDAKYPGEKAVNDQAVTACTAEFTSFIGIDYTESKLEYAYYYPTKGSWADGDRNIVCLATDPAGPVTGTLKGAAR